METADRSPLTGYCNVERRQLSTTAERLSLPQQFIGRCASRTITILISWKNVRMETKSIGYVRERDRDWKREKASCVGKSCSLVFTGYWTLDFARSHYCLDAFSKNVDSVLDNSRRTLQQYIEETIEIRLIRLKRDAKKFSLRISYQRILRWNEEQNKDIPFSFNRDPRDTEKNGSYPRRFVRISIFAYVKDWKPHHGKPRSEHCAEEDFRFHLMVGWS